jgi:hypothetical protein
MSMQIFKTVAQAIQDFRTYGFDFKRRQYVQAWGHDPKNAKTLVAQLMRNLRGEKDDHEEALGDLAVGTTFVAAKSYDEKFRSQKSDK